jgi:FAD synthase
MRLRDKAEALAASGIAELRVLRFDAALAGMDAETFIGQVLVQTMRAKRVVIGEGFPSAWAEAARRRSWQRVRRSRSAISFRS